MKTLLDLFHAMADYPDGKCWCTVVGVDDADLSILGGGIVRWYRHTSRTQFVRAAITAGIGQPQLGRQLNPSWSIRFGNIENGPSNKFEDPHFEGTINEFFNWANNGFIELLD